MKAVILAAGMGTRLNSFTTKPKCCVIVNEQSLLERQVKLFREHNIQNIYIVVGYKKEIIYQLSDRKNLNIRFIINPAYKSTGNLYSLYLALQHFNDDFIAVYGDAIFIDETLEKLLSCPSEATIINREEYKIGKFSKNVRRRILEHMNNRLSDWITPLIRMPDLSKAISLIYLHDDNIMDIDYENDYKVAVKKFE